MLVELKLPISGRVVYFAPSRSAEPRPFTVVVLPGTAQPISAFVRKFPTHRWSESFHVVVVAATPRGKLQGGVWLPGPWRPPASLRPEDYNREVLSRDGRPWRNTRDLAAVAEAATVVGRIAPTRGIWLAGHSGGGCFASVAAEWLSDETLRERQVGVVPPLWPSLAPVAGVVINAGWVWPWIAQRISANGGRARYDACLRYGCRDTLVRPQRHLDRSVAAYWDGWPGWRRIGPIAAVIKSAGTSGSCRPADGATTQAVAEDDGYSALRVSVLRYGFHRWLADDDADLIRWMNVRGKVLTGRLGL